MHSFHAIGLMRHASILTAAVVLTAGTANAQFARSADSSNEPTASVTESSSASGSMSAIDGGDGLAALPATPGANGSGAAGQYGGYDTHGRGLWSRMTWVAGGGFNAPTSSSSNDITWGGNLTVGSGFHLNPRLSALIEYQFIDDKIPGRLINEVGANGGHAHIWSFTVDPVFDLFPKRTNDVYVTGGGGFYRKVTSFTDPQPVEFCTYFYCGIGYQNTVVGHFSSNQGGWNIGAGYQHRLGGMYGDSKMKLFAEARYLEVMTPATTTAPNGLGVTSVSADTKLVPVTLGVRW